MTQFRGHPVCLTVCNGSGCDTICRAVNVGVSAVNTTAEKPAPAFRVFPNPASEVLQVVVDPGFVADPGKIEFAMFDLQGKCRYRDRITAGRTTLTLDRFPSGCYVYRIVHNDRVLQRGRVVVIH